MIKMLLAGLSLLLSGQAALATVMEARCTILKRYEHPGYNGGVFELSCKSDDGVTSTRYFYGPHDLEMDCVPKDDGTVMHKMVKADAQTWLNDCKVDPGSVVIFSFWIDQTYDRTLPIAPPPGMKSASNAPARPAANAGTDVKKLNCEWGPGFPQVIAAASPICHGEVVCKGYLRSLNADVDGLKMTISCEKKYNSGCDANSCFDRKLAVQDVDGKGSGGGGAGNSAGGEVAR